MPTFVWISDVFEKGIVFEAKDDDEAYRKVIARRTEFEGVESAVSHFTRNDRIIELSDERLDVTPFEGEIPEYKEG